MKNLKENFPAYVLGFFVWLLCLIFLPKIWATVTLLLGVGQLFSCSNLKRELTNLWWKKQEAKNRI
jgi:hypothetical protein